MTYRISLGRMMLAVAVIALVMLGGIDFVFGDLSGESAVR